MSPLIVLHRGKPFATLGLPGGRVIVNFTAQMAVSLIDFKDTAQGVVSAPRVHTEGAEPIKLAEIHTEVVEELHKRCHKVEVVRYLGGEANAIVIDPKSDYVDAAASGKPPGVFMV